MSERVRVEPKTAGTASARPDIEQDGGEEEQRQFKRLRRLAQSKTGVKLSDKAIHALVTRAKARKLENEQLRTSAASAEATRSKSGADGEQTTRTRASRTAGTAQTRGSDGLTPEAREQIRSDPKASPTLPPVNTPPPTPEQAEQLLARVMGHLEVDGEPLTPKHLRQDAKTQQPRPKLQQGDGKKTATKSMRPTSLTMSLRAAGPKVPTKVQPRSQATPVRTSVPQAALTQAQTPRRVGTPIPPQDAAPPSNEPKTHGTPPREKFNGATFNWEAFFVMFSIRYQEDLNDWRKMMRELRFAQGRNAALSVMVKASLRAAVQRFQRVDTGAKAAGASGRLVDSTGRAEGEMAVQPLIEGDTGSESRFDRSTEEFNAQDPTAKRSLSQQILETSYDIIRPHLDTANDGNSGGDAPADGDPLLPKEARLLAPQEKRAIRDALRAEGKGELYEEFAEHLEKSAEYLRENHPAAYIAYMRGIEGGAEPDTRDRRHAIQSTEREMIESHKSDRENLRYNQQLLRTREVWNSALGTLEDGETGINELKGELESNELDDETRAKKESELAEKERNLQMARNRVTYHGGPEQLRRKVDALDQMLISDPKMLTEGREKLDDLYEKIEEGVETLAEDTGRTPESLNDLLTSDKDTIEAFTEKQNKLFEQLKAARTQADETKRAHVNLTRAGVSDEERAQAKRTLATQYLDGESRYIGDDEKTNMKVNAQDFGGGIAGAAQALYAGLSLFRMAPADELQFAQSAERLNSREFMGAVDAAVSQAVGSAAQYRDQLDAETRRLVGPAAGMIDRLWQTIQMGRQII